MSLIIRAGNTLAAHTCTVNKIYIYNFSSGQSLIAASVHGLTVELIASNQGDSFAVCRLLKGEKEAGWQVERSK